MTDRPAPDPAKLLEDWMAFEDGEEEPGRVLANLKKGGFREVLEALASSAAAGTGADG